MITRRTLSIFAVSCFLAGLSLGSLATSTITARADLRGSGVFGDVPAGAYYDDAVGDMYETGIITGYEDGRFGPDDFVTRGQVAVMMKRFKDSLNGTSTTQRSSQFTVQPRPALIEQPLELLVVEHGSGFFCWPRGRFPLHHRVIQH